MVDNRTEVPSAPTDDELQKVIDIEGGYKHNDGIIIFPAANAKATVVLAHGGTGMVCVTDTDETYGHLMPSSAVRFLKARNINVVLVHTAPNPLSFSIGTIMSKLPWITTNDKQLTANLIITSTVFLKNRARNGWGENTLTDIHHGLESFCDNTHIAINYFDTPVYLFGLCNSNYLFSYYYNQLKDSEKHKVSGIIFSSMYTKEILHTVPDSVKDQFYESLNFFRKNEALDIPILILHHENDFSEGTSPDNARLAQKQIKSSKEVTLYIAEGGINEGDPKLGYGHHGFRGIEGKIANVIANFIERQA